MGGDGGAATMIAGAALARAQWPDLRFLLVGHEAEMAAEVAKHPGLTTCVELAHAPDKIAGEEKPSQAIRRAKTTSMGIAIDLVKQGRAGAALSAGNTGAMMAMAKLSLRTLNGIDRPALAALLPTLGEYRVRSAHPRRIGSDGRRLFAHCLGRRAPVCRPAKHRQRRAEGH